MPRQKDMKFQKSLSLENTKILQKGYASVNFMEMKTGNSLEILKLKVSMEKQGQNRKKNPSKTQSLVNCSEATKQFSKALLEKSASAHY